MGRLLHQDLWEILVFFLTLWHHHWVFVCLVDWLQQVFSLFAIRTQALQRQGSENTAYMYNNCRRVLLLNSLDRNAIYSVCIVFAPITCPMLFQKTWPTLVTNHNQFSACLTCLFHKGFVLLAIKLYVLIPSLSGFHTGFYFCRGVGSFGNRSFADHAFLEGLGPCLPRKVFPWANSDDVLYWQQFTTPSSVLLRWTSPTTFSWRCLMMGKSLFYIRVIIASDLVMLCGEMCSVRNSN